MPFRLRIPVADVVKAFETMQTSATSRLKVGVTLKPTATHYVIPTERSDEESAAAPASASQRSLENRRTSEDSSVAGSFGMT